MAGILSQEEIDVLLGDGLDLKEAFKRLMTNNNEEVDTTYERNYLNKLKKETQMTNTEKLAEAQKIVRRLEEEIEAEQKRNTEFVLKEEAIHKLDGVFDKLQESWTSEEINSLISCIELKEVVGKKIKEAKNIGGESLKFVERTLAELSKTDGKRAFDSFMNSFTNTK